jgi:hypothetical protein
MKAVPFGPSLFVVPRKTAIVSGMKLKPDPRPDSASATAMVQKPVSSVISYVCMTFDWAITAKPIPSNSRASTLATSLTNGMTQSPMANSSRIVNRREPKPLEVPQIPLENR